MFDTIIFTRNDTSDLSMSMSSMPPVIASSTANAAVSPMSTSMSMDGMDRGGSDDTCKISVSLQEMSSTSRKLSHNTKDAVELVHP